jgi:hypothetical protein
MLWCCGAVKHTSDNELHQTKAFPSFSSGSSFGTPLLGRRMHGRFRLRKLYGPIIELMLLQQCLRVHQSVIPVSTQIHSELFHSTVVPGRHFKNIISHRYEGFPVSRGATEERWPAEKW